MGALFKIVTLTMCLMALASCQPFPPGQQQASAAASEAQAEPDAGTCPGTACRAPAWSPDGSRIVFVADMSWHGPLVAANAELTTFWNLLDPSRDLDLTPCATGTARVNGSVPQSGLVITETVVVSPTSSSRAYPDGLYSEPAWSPRADVIAFSFIPSKDESAKGFLRGIYAAGVDHPGMKLLIPLPYGEGGVSWSPDGGRLLYARVDESGLAWICIANSDGTGEKAIKQVPLYTQAAWSPDGSYIAFIPGGQVRDVMMMNTDGTQMRNLTNDGQAEYERSLAWSPDSKRLVFTTLSDDPKPDTHRLYVINVDGSGRKLVAEGPHYGPLAWSPNGEWLVVEEWGSVKAGRESSFLIKLKVDF